MSREVHVRFCESLGVQFPGATHPHICGKSRKGKFLVIRQTIRKRMQAKLKAIRIELRRRMHEPLKEQGQWLRAVVDGHIRYYGVPGNWAALRTFRQQVE